MNIFRLINDKLKKIELIFGAVSLFAIFLIISINVFRRYFLNSAWGWAGELNGFIYAWVAFISAAYTTAEDGHVRIAIVDEKLGVRFAQIMRIFTDLIIIVAFVWLFFPTINALKAMRLTAALRWPKGLVYSGLLVGYALFIVHSVLQIIKRVHFLRTGVDILSSNTTNPQPPLNLANKDDNHM